MQSNSLVLYKQQATRIISVGNKLDILTADGKSVKVREKDVTLLHPGPLTNFAQLQPQTGDVETAWELLQGETTTLEELAELIYEDFTPATAWAVWELVVDGLRFSGQPDAITVRTPDDVAEMEGSRAKKEAEARAWSDFMARIESALAGDDVAFLAEDEPYLQEVVEVANQQGNRSRLLAELDMPLTRERGHAFLLDIGYWQPAHNPYPARQGVFMNAPEGELPALNLQEPRTDLTHLPAFAIDDEGSTDPDDAISVEGNRLWVHIADVAALVAPDTPADWEARARGANVYLPEKVVPMLPPNATHQLGMGLNETSPALSVGMDIGEGGEIAGIHITPSHVKVTRLTYAGADAQLNTEPLATLWKIAQNNRNRRIANGSTEIDLPELKVRVNEDGTVRLKPIDPLNSRELVREAMLLAGEAVGRFAIENEIAIPFSSQPPRREYDGTLPDGIAGMFAIRRTFRPGKRTTQPNPHSGLGMDVYVQVTSPLRRYLDLVVHQQLRTFLRGDTPLDESQIYQRIGAVDAIAGNVRRAGRLSDRHWVLIYLLQNPDWEGEGLVMEANGNRHTILIPDLAVETIIYLPHQHNLNEAISLKFDSVNIPELEAHFRTL